MTAASHASRSDARWWSIERARGARLGPAIVGLIGLVMIHHPMLFSGLAQIQSDVIDSRLINYLLEHSYRWVAGDRAHRQFWDIPFFYPAPNVAAFSDTLLSIAPVYWVWRGLGFLPDTAFQLWMLSTSTLNYISGYWLLRSGFRRGRLGSSCGAFLFAFGASRINQLDHQQLLPQVYTVVMLLALLRIFTGRPSSLARSWILWMIAGLSLVAQLYAAFYLGWFLVLALGLAGLWGLVLAPCRPVLLAVIRDQWPAIAGSAAASSLAVYPLLTHYLQAANQVGMRSDFEMMLSVPYWTTWVYEGPQSWVWGWLHRVPPFDSLDLEQAQRMGIGVVTPLVCAAGLLQRWREPVVRLVALSMLSLLIVVTRFGRELWEGVGLGLWVICAAELFRRSRSVWHRCVLGSLALVLGLTLFPGLTLALALVLAALPYWASRFLPDRSRILVQALAPTLLTGFACLTAYAHRPLGLGAGMVVAALLLAGAWRGAKPGARHAGHRQRGHRSVVVVLSK